MLSFAMPRFHLPDWLALAMASGRTGERSTEADQDADRARRDFMLEMLDRHPESFSSDQSVQSMLSLYRERF